jgi:uncharacterized membrane protein YhaH (DUF805 family)
MERSSRVWLLTPLVAVVVTMVGAIVLFKVQADRTIWLAACDSRTFIGCGLASIFFCAAAVVIAVGVAAGIARRRDRSAAGAVGVGFLVAVVCLAGLLGATAASGAVMT